MHYEFWILFIFNGNWKKCLIDFCDQDVRALYNPYYWYVIDQDELLQFLKCFSDQDEPAESAGHVRVPEAPWGGQPPVLQDLHGVHPLPRIQDRNYHGKQSFWLFMKVSILDAGWDLIIIDYFIFKDDMRVFK